MFEIQFIGEVDQILDPAVDSMPALQHTEGPVAIQQGRKLVTFKDGRLWQLSEPITYGTPGQGKAPPGLQFHQFYKLVNSATLDDLRA